MLACSPRHHARIVLCIALALTLAVATVLLLRSVLLRVSGPPLVVGLDLLLDLLLGRRMLVGHLPPASLLLDLEHLDLLLQLLLAVAAVLGIGVSQDSVVLGVVLVLLQERDSAVVAMLLRILPLLGIVLALLSGLPLLVGLLLLLQLLLGVLHLVDVRMGLGDFGLRLQLHLQLLHRAAGAVALIVSPLLRGGALLGILVAVLVAHNLGKECLELLQRDLAIAVRVGRSNETISLLLGHMEGIDQLLRADLAAAVCVRSVEKLLLNCGVAHIRVLALLVILRAQFACKTLEEKAEALRLQDGVVASRRLVLKEGDSAVVGVALATVLLLLLLLLLVRCVLPLVSVHLLVVSLDLLLDLLLGRRLVRRVGHLPPASLLLDLEHLDLLLQLLLAVAAVLGIGVGQDGVVLGV